MAKHVYKIPTSLGLSWLDQEISLIDNTTAKQFQLRLLLSWLGSLFIGFWLVSQTFLGKAGVALTGLFVVWWVAATLFYCRNDATKRMRLLGLADLPGYLPKARRRVSARASSPAQGLLDLTRLASVGQPRRVGEPALITFTDGGLGHAYQVVGSASLLLFDSDQSAILDRVDSFYRKTDTSAEWVTITLKRAQRVDAQLGRIERLRRAHAGNAQLLAVLDDRAEVLASEVGRDYLSIQQYLVVLASGREALDRAHSLVEAESAESSLMFRSVEPLDRGRTLELLSELYKG